MDVTDYPYTFFHNDDILNPAFFIGKGKVEGWLRNERDPWQQGVLPATPRAPESEPRRTKWIQVRFLEWQKSCLSSLLRAGRHDLLRDGRRRISSAA